jgi:hypothetical protein
MVAGQRLIERDYRDRQWENVFGIIGGLAVSLEESCRETRVIIDMGEMARQWRDGRSNATSSRCGIAWRRSAVRNKR